MPHYLRAYALRELRAFPGWSESSCTAVAEEPDEAPAPDAVAGPLSDDEVVYLHEDLRVTRGVVEDEQVIFEGASAEWEAFCRSRLGFEVPDWEAESRAVRAALDADPQPDGRGPRRAEGKAS